MTTSVMVNSSRLVSPTFTCDAADFDGTNDYMSRGALSGAVDSKKGLLSAWIRLDGGDGTFQVVFLGEISSGADRFYLLRADTNKFQLIASNASGTAILSLVTSSTYTTSTTWLNVLSSWDLATAGARHLYVNGVSDMVVNTFTDDTIDYTLDNFYVSNSGSGNLVNGALAELYFSSGQYLDLSDAGNRSKFISGSGKAVNLNADGSRPTGGIPLVYLHLDHLESAANFATNRGSGGDFSITGSLDTASTSPSD